MATYTITINERTNSGKKLMDYLKSIDGVKVEKAPDLSPPKLVRL